MEACGKRAQKDPILAFCTVDFSYGILRGAKAILGSHIKLKHTKISGLETSFKICQRTVIENTVLLYL